MKWNKSFTSSYFFSNTLAFISGCTRSLLLHRLFSSFSEKQLLFNAVLRLIMVVSLVVKHGLQELGLEQLQHVGLVVAARGLQSTNWELWHMGSVAPRHVGSS